MEAEPGGAARARAAPGEGSHGWAFWIDTSTPDVWAKKLRGAIEKRGYLGGTDLFAALTRLKEIAAKDPSVRHVLVSDGVATLGKTAPGDLLSALEGLPEKTPLSALVLGSRQDAGLLGKLVAGHGRIVRIPFSESMDESAKEAAARLARPAGPTLRIADRSAEWIFQVEAHDVQAGNEILAIGKVKAGATPSARLVQGAKTLASAAEAVTMPAGAFEPLLTLLVLESEADYGRFNLDRRALESILTVGATGIERLDRANVPTYVTSVTSPEGDRFAQANGRKRQLAGADAEKNELAEGRRDEAQAVMQEVVVMAESPGGADLAVAAAPSPERENLDMPRPAAPPAQTSIAPRERAERDDGHAVSSAAPAEERKATSGSGGGDRSTTLRRVAPRPPSPMPHQAPVPWTQPVKPTADEIARLTSSVDANPRDRDAYNRLSDALFAAEDWKRLRDLALRWQPYDAENPQVYECLGETDLHLDRMSEARRAFGSLVEIAPGKPELLQRAGLLLFRAGAGTLAETPLRRALELRPDRVNAYRNLALFLWQSGRLDEAASVLESAARQKFPGWYGDARRVVTEELGYVYRAMLAKASTRARSEIEKKARELGVSLARCDALRVTLSWETDANDVDLHVVDPNGEECFYGHRATASGLQLYEDITQGLGPEVIRTAQRTAGTYSIGVNYFSAGPMGVSRGVLVVVNPKGDEDTVEILPFRLVAGSRDMRLLARVGTGAESAKVARVVKVKR